MALYGAPIWVGALDRENVAALRRPQRAMAIRAIRGYRSVSGDAACLLAGSPPWDLEARARAAMYNWRAALRSRGEEPLPGDVNARKSQLKRALRREWKARLEDSRTGRWTVEAILPVLSEWLNKRRRGPVTFRLTQVLTGHGCFGKYLFQIAGREVSPKCHECDVCDQDTAQHVIEECPAFAEERRDLVADIGNDLSLSAIARQMVTSRECWTAVVRFCEAVMSKKEAAERDRELDPSAALIRRRRLRGRRRRDSNSVPSPPPGQLNN